MSAEPVQEKKQKLWYIRRSETVQGPFPSGTLRRFVLLGRVKLSDQVSLDKQLWESVSRVPEVVPPEVRKAAAEGHLEDVLPIHLREDERGLERRRKEHDNKYKNQRKGQRRQDEPELMQRHRQAKAELLQLEKKPRKTPFVAMAVSTMLVMLAVGVGLYIGGPASIQDPDCNAKAGPGVNWRNCRLDAVSFESANMEGAILNSSILRMAKLPGAIFTMADLQYADLSGSDLSYAEFTHAKMKGINLQSADLTYADFSNSDLSYANLRGSNIGGAKMGGAIFDRAIWIDGTVCGPGSLGGCIKQ
ncbi:MAG: pentapeptide repeat-containing protein [Gammaproteobacteria bacterium]